MALRRFTLAFPVLLVLFVGACGGPATIPTGQMMTAPSVDGSIDDWNGRLTYVGDRPVSMSAFPTDSLLYVAISIQDQRLVRAVAANGLMVWVDPAGQQKNEYGIRYPLGLRRQGRTAGGSGGSSPPATQAAAFDRVSLSELEVVWGDSSRRRIPARFSSGLRGQAMLNPGSLIYELAIPVGRTEGADEGRQYGLQTSLGAPFSIGIEMPQPDGERREVSPQGGIPSVAGRPAGGGGRAGTGAVVNDNDGRPRSSLIGPISISGFRSSQRVLHRTDS